MESDYLVREKPMKALLYFAFPIILGNLFQQMYTMADSVIVGQFVSEEALAAIGASYALTNIFICVAQGAGLGASVLVSMYFGARQFDKMKTAVNTALVSFFVISVFLGAFGAFFCRPIMVLLSTPANVLDMAIQYLSIYFLGLPFLFMYNVLSAMFNALGKSKIPLYFLIFSSVFNIVLAIFLVAVCHLGIVGAAWATLIAQSISALLSFVVLRKVVRRFGNDRGKRFAKSELWPMFRIALPSVLQQSTVSIGMMLVQSVVNQFGSEMLAGFSAAMRIEAICVVPMIGIGNAVSSFAAQNIGASQNDRVVYGLRAANKLVAIFAVIILIVLESFNTPIISAFLGSNGTSVALQTGCDYLAFMGFFFCFIGIKMSVDGLLRGAGDMKMFTIANFVNLGIRVAVAMICAPHWGIQMVWIAVPIGWFANWIISYAQYRTGTWKTIYKGTAK